MSRSNGLHSPGEPTPSKLGRILKGAHDNARTQRAIANTAKGRRIKAQQARDEKKGNKK
jgi:hypothetical protein